MSSALALLDPADRASSTQRSQRDEDAQYYRQVLHKLIAMGTDLAEAVHRQALAEPAAAPQPAAPHNQPEDEPAAPSPTPNQAITFDRLARCVRRTIALARKLSEPAREAPGPKECPKQRRTASAETDALYAEPCERPEAPDCDAPEDLDEDLDDDLDDQSLTDLIASLRHDTALATLSDAELRQHRTPQDARALCAHREAIPRMELVRQSRPTPRSGCKAAKPSTGPPA